ncbi:hypothetical protein [Mameliella alba]|uniref:hypothetical protein n=1 Tax=Mameliella alba TaxID=561184 RepID=UPI0010548FD3|nr:hypothetical protein [Mameliella alba]
MQPELTSELSARQWCWLCERVGQEAALRALEAAVKRGRKPWPLNAARELGLRMPHEAALPPVPSQTSAEDVEAVKQRLRELRMELAARAALRGRA